MMSGVSAGARWGDAWLIGTAHQGVAAGANPA
jgi:hypothetical protein